MLRWWSWRSSPVTYASLFDDRPHPTYRNSPLWLTGRFHLHIDELGSELDGSRHDSGARAWHAIASSSDGTVRQVRNQDAHAHVTPHPCVPAALRVVVVAFVASLSLTPPCSTADPIQPIQQRLAAVVKDGFIYTSTNSGVTWTQQDDSESRTWLAIASSSDGTVRQVWNQDANADVTSHPCVFVCVERWWSWRSSPPSHSRLLARRPTAPNPSNRDSPPSLMEVSSTHRLTRVRPGRRGPPMRHVLWYAIASSSDGTVRQIRDEVANRRAPRTHACLPWCRAAALSWRSWPLTHACLLDDRPIQPTETCRRGY